MKRKRGIKGEEREEDGEEDVEERDGGKGKR